MSRENSSYYQIVRSSFLIGGASAITLTIGLIRNKMLALFLGPAGIGLIGLYTAIVDVGHSIASMGVNQSGIRQIAESAARDEKVNTAIIASVLRRTSVILGALGAAAVFFGANYISQLTFGNTDRAGAIRILAGAILFKQVADGRGALLQGLRKIGRLAKANVATSFLSSIVLITIAVALGEAGIAPAIVAAAALSAFIMAWYSSRLGARPPTVSLGRFLDEANSLLKLGSAFMVSGLMMMGAAYAIRAIVSTENGVQAAGLYQAAWTLGGMYSGFILQSMGTDFYPRLVGVIGDPDVRRRLVNEQTVTSLVLAGPGILATLSLAPLALMLLYSQEFLGAAETLRWICMGMALRVLTWPPGFLIVSMNERWVFMATEIIWAIANVGLALALVPRLGLEGAGIAFAGSYVVHGTVVYTIVGFRYQFRPDRLTVIGGAIFLASSATALLIGRTLTGIAGIAVGVGITLIASAVSIRVLARLLPPEHLPRPVLRTLRWLRVIDGEQA